MAKLTGVKKEVAEEIAAVTTKVKLNKESLVKLYGFVPTKLYFGGSQLDCSQDEIEVRSELAELLKQEGLI